MFRLTRLFPGAALLILLAVLPARDDQLKASFYIPLTCLRSNFERHVVDLCRARQYSALTTADFVS